MKKVAIITLSSLLVILLLLLSSCAKSGYVTLTYPTTTKTLPVITLTQTASTSRVTINKTDLAEQIAGTEEGVIEIEGAGLFYYQSDMTPLDEDIFKGITFSSYIGEGTTVTGPVNYWLWVEFDDGAKEDLNNVSLYMGNYGIDINPTKHQDPQAGVMFVTSEDIYEIYLLVSLAG
ncbi:MAG: hypothetical protein ACOWWO_03975 [Peptococcaceae bacterium]